LRTATAYINHFLAKALLGGVRYRGTVLPSYLQARISTRWAGRACAGPRRAPEEPGGVLGRRLLEELEQAAHGLVRLELRARAAHVCYDRQSAAARRCTGRGCAPVLTQPGSMQKMMRSVRSFACLYVCGRARERT
jgi:hypothetical protein